MLRSLMQLPIRKRGAGKQLRNYAQLYDAISICERRSQEKFRQNMLSSVTQFPNMKLEARKKIAQNMLI